MPRYTEQYSSVPCLRYHQSRISSQESGIDYNMHSLTGTYFLATLRLIHLHDIVHINTGSVHYPFYIYFIRSAFKSIFQSRPANLPGIILNQRRYFHIIDAYRTVVMSTLHQCNRHSRIVELPVVVNHASTQMIVQQSRQLLQGLFLGQRQRPPQAQSPGQQIVTTQPDGIKRTFPPTIVADNETHILYQMGGIAP